MVRSHLSMRRWIGTLGVLLPVVLLLSSDWVPKATISHYYASSVFWIPGYFVGSLCAFGVFLYCYRGHTINGTRPTRPLRWLSDDWATTVAGLSAIATAIVPRDSGAY